MGCTGREEGADELDGAWPAAADTVGFARAACGRCCLGRGDGGGGSYGVHAGDHGTGHRRVRGRLGIDDGRHDAAVGDAVRFAVLADAAGSAWLAVAIFGACGIYQLTPLKDRCLARCRSPLGFVLKLGSYRGRTRDLRVGLYHGTFCLACCWALMALLVAFGLMNVIAMVVLAGAVLAEKTWVWGPQFSRVLGVAALGLAAAVVLVPGLAPGLLQVTHPGQMGGM